MLDDLQYYLSTWLTAGVGRSVWFDSLLGLSLKNELVKSVPLAACFLSAWHSGEDRVRLARRRILLIAIVAAIAASGLSRSLSESNSRPRPYVLSQRVYQFSDGEAIEQPRRPLPVPMDNASQERVAALLEGDVPQNDFQSAPSDHASLFFALSLGITMAWPAAGGPALLWTLFVIVVPRLWFGLHSPADIVTGCALGASGLLALRLVFDRWAATPLDRITTFLSQREHLSSPLLFVILFEICVTFDHVKALGSAFKSRVLGW